MMLVFNGRKRVSGQTRELSSFYVVDDWIAHRDPANNKLELGDGWQRAGTWILTELLDPVLPMTKHGTSHFLRCYRETVKFSGGHQLIRGPLIYGITAENPLGFNEWWAKLWVMSEDNWTPAMIAVGFCDGPVCGLAAQDMAKALIKRFGFFWNYKTIGSMEINKKVPDVAFLTTYGVIIRSLKLWYLWPLLVVCDAWLLLQSVVRVVASIFFPKDTGPCLNHQLRLIQARKRLPTPISWLARWLYTHLRMNPVNEETGLRMKGYAVYNVWVQYFMGWGKPPVDVLVKPMIMEYL